MVQLAIPFLVFFPTLLFIGKDIKPADEEEYASDSQNTNATESQEPLTKEEIQEDPPAEEFNFSHLLNQENSLDKEDED